MRRHIVDPQFRARLADLMRDAGLSQRSLAARAHIAPSYVSEILAGLKSPSADMAAALDAALGAGGTLARLVIPTGPAHDLDLLAATTHHRAVSLDTIDALDGVLRAQRRLDDMVGSATLLPPVLAHLDTVTAMTVDTTGPHRPALVGMAAQWAQFAGWLHTSTGRFADAKTWFARALELAFEAEDRDMVATVISYQGHVAWLTGQIPPSTGLAEAAMRDETVYPGQRAYDAYAVARGRAAQGDLGAAERMLAVGEQLAHESDEWTGEIPPWQYYRQPWFWALERGLVRLHMARHDQRHAQAAVAELQAGIDGMPLDMRNADWCGEYLVYFAAAHHRAGQLPQARTVLGQARRIAETTRSARIQALVDARERQLALR